MISIRSSFLACLLSIAVAPTAFGDLVTPVSVTPSSQFAAANNMINGSGLIGGGPVEARLHDNNENNMWQTFNLVSGTSVGETAEFVLDQNYNLSSALIWQYNGPNGFGLPEPDREVDEFELAVSNSLATPFVSLGTFRLNPASNQLAPPPAGEPAQSFALSGANDVRRVLLTIRSVQGGVSDGAAGLSEVRFVGTAIPEPTTLALVAGGGLLLVASRRIKKNRTY